MITDPTVVLSNILDIVNYSEDKKAFIDQFSQSCMIRGFSDIENFLPQDKKYKFSLALSANKSEDEVKEIICEFVSDELYEKAIQDATSDLFLDLLQAIEPTLTADQSKSLDNYLSSL